MVIVRNGVEYELTGMEEYEVYRKVKREYLIEDIKAKAEEMKLDLTGVDLEQLADCVEDSLGNNDGYYECYWMSIDETLADIEETTQN